MLVCGAAEKPGLRECAGLADFRGDPSDDAGRWRIERRERRKRELARRRVRARLTASGLLVAALAIVAVVVVSSTKAHSPSASSSGQGAASNRGGGESGGGGRGSAQSGGGRASSSVAAHSGGPHSESPATPADNLPRPPRYVSAPILMYHVINPPPEGAPFPGLYVAKQEFAQQVKALAQAGFHAVTLQQLWQHWKTGAPLPRGKPIVLSFDNGYQSQYTNALPILRKYGWKGVENIQLSGLPPSEGGLSQAQVRGLVSAGWELDTQGYSHAELVALSPEELRFQVVTTRKRIQRLYHVPVHWFCYPSGHYDATVIEAVKEAGYIGSTTVVPGWASPSNDPYQLPRIRVLRGTSGQALVDLIEATKHNPPPPPVYE